MPPAEAYGVATFYAMFSVEPRATTVVHVCDDLACRVAGAEAICAHLEEAYGPVGAAAEGAGDATWVRSPCLGLCERAPAVLFQRAGAGAADMVFAPASAEQAAAVGRGARLTSAGSRLPRSTAPICDSCDGSASSIPTRSTTIARTVGTRRSGARSSSAPRARSAEVTDAKLMGRGGAAFPTGVKWKAVAEQPVHPHYFICNADESEPGTFKDRVVMEHDPYAVIEALTIAGFTTGSEQGFVYIRGEYPLATRRLQHAIEEARRHGFLGDDVMGEGFAFDIELRRGAGAYICGEETALFNSLEGKRGEPRNKPPFPVQRGLFGKPTGINNVETLINVLEILRIGDARRTPRSAPRAPPARACSASRATSRAPASTRTSTVSRCASC